MKVKTKVAIPLAFLATATFTAYFLYPWLCRRSATHAEKIASLAGDEIVSFDINGCTLAITIAAPREEVWPWLVQMGQGRAGFYTHEWVENALGARIRNAQRIEPALQQLDVGSRVRLTPDPYLGQPGQYIVVHRIQMPEHLVFRQTLPSGGTSSWAYILKPAGDGSTRLIFRRRGTRPSMFDRVMEPGYYFMDRGMLEGIRQRAETR